MFDSDTQGFYKSEQQESSIMRRSFNPHALQRSAPLLHVGAVYHHEFQSTRPVWGAPQIVAISHEAFCVSIHAPRVGHDLYFSMIWIALSSFQSTRPVWGATFSHTAFICALKFQSTRPVWGATMHLICRRQHLSFQSTRPVWGATQAFNRIDPDTRFQSTRPVWGATSQTTEYVTPCTFQSTRPVWGATYYNRCCSRWRIVSIHAPRVGRDRSLSPIRRARYGFNPRAPCGARRQQSARGSGC